MNHEHSLLCAPQCHPWILSVGLATFVFCVAPSEARTWRVPQEAPTIQAGIEAASNGDDVLVAPGTYLEHSLEIRESIVVHSQGGAAATVIDAEGVDRIFDIRDVAAGARIEGFTLMNGGHGSLDQGGGMVIYRSVVTLARCAVLNCNGGLEGGGVWAVDSFITIEECHFAENRALGGGAIVVGTYGLPSGLRVMESEFVGNAGSYGLCCPAAGAIYATGEVSIAESLFDGNSVGAYGLGAAVVLGDGIATIERCTFVNNVAPWDTSTGVIESIQSGTVRLENCIIAFNRARAFRCAPTTSSVRCCDMYGNEGGDEVCGTDDGGNFTADPLFCDLAQGNYRLSNTSPCLPDHHPDGVACGLIGAFGAGCETTPVETTSWARIKDLYRP